MAVELEDSWVLQKLQNLRFGASAILLKKVESGVVGVEVKDFVAVLRWIYTGKVVQEAVVGFNDDGSPIVQRTERDPTLEEIKQRWRDSGYVEIFEKWLADGLITTTDLKALFGSEKPWL